MDFGIARAVADGQATVTATAAVIGTAQYLSPEQARGEQVDTRSDLYSTGCLLFELMTGRPPFVADSPVAVAYQHVREQPPAPSQLAHGIPEAVDRIVLHSLAKEREARYQSAAEFRADVEAARAGRQVAAQPVPVASVSDTATQYLGAAGQGTRAMAPVGGGLLEGPNGPTTPYDDRYGQYDPNRYDEQRSRKTPWIVAGVVVAVLALVAYLVSQLVGGNPPGSANVSVPSVIGQPAALATSTLTDAGFKVTPESKVTDDAEQIGKVIDQDPDANTSVARGSNVKIVVGTEPGTVEVPDVVGKPQEDAISEITDAGLSIAKVETETPKDGDVEPGEVISTDPEPGTEVNKGDKVTLVVANDRVALDNYLGRQFEDARQELVGLGFEVKRATRVDGNAAEGSVVAQNPRGGSEVKRDSTVTLTVAIAPEPTNEPTQSPSPSDTSSPDPSSSASETGDPGDG
jgi:serine/threonine-protein kinase